MGSNPALIPYSLFFFAKITYSFMKYMTTFYLLMEVKEYEKIKKD